MAQLDISGERTRDRNDGNAEYHRAPESIEESDDKDHAVVWDVFAVRIRNMLSIDKST